MKKLFEHIRQAMRKLVERFRRCVIEWQENKFIAQRWKKQPEKMLNLAAADMLEEVILTKAYGEPFGHFMCIALCDAKTRKDGRTKQVRERAKNIVMMSIYPDLTLMSHLTENNKIPGTVNLYSDEYINDYGAPYYRELIHKIRWAVNNSGV